MRQPFFCRGATWGARSSPSVHKYLTYTRRARHVRAPTVKFNLSGPFGPPPARLSVLAAVLRFPAVNA